MKKYKLLINGKTINTNLTVKQANKILLTLIREGANPEKLKIIRIG